MTSQQKLTSGLAIHGLSKSKIIYGKIFNRIVHNRAIQSDTGLQGAQAVSTIRRTLQNHDSILAIGSKSQRYSHDATRNTALIETGLGRPGAGWASMEPRNLKFQRKFTVMRSAHVREGSNLEALAQYQRTTRAIGLIILTDSNVQVQITQDLRNLEVPTLLLNVSDSLPNLQSTYHINLPYINTTQISLLLEHIQELIYQQLAIETRTDFAVGYVSKASFDQHEYRGKQLMRGLSGNTQHRFRPKFKPGQDLARLKVKQWQLKQERNKLKP